MAKPNIIFILADDMGWTGVGCYGSPFYDTAHIDRLAREGMRFTQAYAAAPLCSPTRASILTGKYPARLHLTDYIPGEKYPHARMLPPDWTKRLPAGEITIADRLRSAGYATASVGKWHLGQQDARPEHYGFDFSVAGIGRGSPAGYFSPFKNPYLKDGPPGEFLSDRLTKLLQFHEDGRCELYHLDDDIGETSNLAERHADRVAALKSKIEDWRRRVGAQMPSPNPQYDPARAWVMGR